MADKEGNHGACRPDLIRAVPEAVREVWDRLLQVGEGYLVGGAVRDLILSDGGAVPHDFDLATRLPPEVVQEHFRHCGYRVIPTGIRYGTVTVVAQSGEHVEITTFRVEGRYDRHRHPQEVRWGTSLAEDLGRRDFTVNAAALDRQGCLLLPPGMTPAEFAPTAPLRAVGEAEERLKEDPLRILRAYRFAGRLGKSLDPALEAACRRNAHKVRLLSSERIFLELDRILQGTNAGTVLVSMEEAGVLQMALPEWGPCTLLRLSGGEPLSRRLIAAAAAAPPALRWAALLHDIAGPRCPPEGAPEGASCHEQRSAETAEYVLLRMAAPVSFRQRAVTLIRHHRFPWDDAPEAALRRLLARIGPDAARELLLLAEARTIAGGIPWSGRERAAERLEAIIAAQPPTRLRDLVIDGHDVIVVLERHGLRAGPAVGRILHLLGQRVLEHPEENTRQRLLELADEVAVRLRDGLGCRAGGRMV